MPSIRESVEKLSTSVENLEASVELLEEQREKPAKTSKKSKGKAGKQQDMFDNGKDAVTKRLDKAIKDVENLLGEA